MPRRDPAPAVPLPTLVPAPTPVPLPVLILVLGTVLQLPLAVAAAAQEGSSGVPVPGTFFGEALDVELVNVEVFVSDRQGRPVLDLEAGELRVFEDGRPVEITHFSLVGDGASEAGSSAEPPPPAPEPALAEAGAADAQPARVALFIDDVHVGPASRARVFEQVWRTLQEVLRPEDEVMVAVYDGGLRVLTPFTRDRDRLFQALEEESLRGMSARQLQSGFAGDRAMQTIRDLQRNMSQEKQGGAQGTCTDIGFVAQHHAEEEHHRIQQTIRALTGFVNSLAGYPGRKALLHVSDGIPLLAGGEVYRYAIELCDGTGAAQGIRYSEDVSVLNETQRHRWDPYAAKTEMLSYDTTPDWQRLASHANAHQVSVYALQAAGLGSPSSLDIGTNVQTTGETASFGFRNLQDSLELISRETGGAAIFNTNDFTGAIEEMVADTRSHYLVAFEPTNPGDGQIHRLRVEVDRPGVRVRHRRSYRSKGADERVADGVLTALLYERTENPLEARLDAVRRGEAASGLSKVRLRVRLPLGRLALVPRDESRAGRFTVFVAARDDAGQTTPVRQVLVPVVVPAEVSEEGAADEFVYEVEMTMRHGRHQVAVAVRDDLAGTTSYLRDTVTAGGG